MYGKVIWLRVCIMQGDIGNVGIKDLLHLLPNQLKDAVQVVFCDQCLADCVDGRQLGCLVLGLFKEFERFPKPHSW